MKTDPADPGVDQTFGGVFTAETPRPDRENPECEKLDTPPPWVGNAEAVDFAPGPAGARSEPSFTT